MTTFGPVPPLSPRPALFLSRLGCLCARVSISECITHRRHLPRRGTDEMRGEMQSLKGKSTLKRTGSANVDTGSGRLLSICLCPKSLTSPHTPKLRGAKHRSLERSLVFQHSLSWLIFHMVSCPRQQSTLCSPGPRLRYLRSRVVRCPEDTKHTAPQILPTPQRSHILRTTPFLRAHRTSNLLCPRKRQTSWLRKMITSRQRMAPKQVLFSSLIHHLLYLRASQSPSKRRWSARTRRAQNFFGAY